MLKILIGVILGFVIFCNLYVAHTMTTEEMKFEFVTEQGVLGTIFANAFYAFAWGLKRIKNFVK